MLPAGLGRNEAELSVMKGIAESAITVRTARRW